MKKQYGFKLRFKSGDMYFGATYVGLVWAPNKREAKKILNKQFRYGSETEIELWVPDDSLGYESFACYQQN